MTTFSEAFDILLDPKFEGGYSPGRAGDPGGETKFGISKRTYPNLDIKNLTREDVRSIYFRDFWNKCSCENVHVKLRYPLFDYAVNSGPEKAIKDLQKLVNTYPDGDIGPVTLMAIQSYPIDSLVMKYLFTRLYFMSGLPNWDVNSEGWAKRIARIGLMT